MRSFFVIVSTREHAVEKQHKRNKIVHKIGLTPRIQEYHFVKCLGILEDKNEIQNNGCDGHALDVGFIFEWMFYLIYQFVEPR